MSAFNFKSKYARYNAEEIRRENWEESVDRMFQMHRDKYGALLQSEDLLELERVQEKVNRKEMLGSQRALQFGGAGVFKHNMRIYNCAVSYCDRAKFFAECFYMLLCGCGTGFSVQKHHIAQLPELRTTPGIPTTFVIPDEIEGWADAMDALVNYFLGLTDEDPVFDPSLVRKRGAKLSAGGTAPGPEPLMKALKKVREIFERSIENGQLKLRSIDCYDIMMHGADAVLAGGVRRSATICVFSSNDELMINAKTGNWHRENIQRARSNNSALLLRGEDNLEDFKRLMRRCRGFGEPGFIWAWSREHLFNPCVEIGMCPVLIRDSIGNILEEYTLKLLDYDNRSEKEAEGYTFKSGWQCCNLTEMNAAIWKTREEALECAKYAAMLGTLQAGYTDPGYLGETSRLIIEREALLGVSMTGMMDNASLAFDEELQREMARTVVKINRIWAPKIGIRCAPRLTAVKPGGNSTILLSLMTLLPSGVNLHKAKDRMVRRVQVHKDDPVGMYFEQHNPHMVEESVWSANKTDVVISFPIDIREDALSIDDMTAVEFLGYVLRTQQNWVQSGTANPMSCEGLTHNVSNTVDVNPDEWGDVGRFIYENRKDFSGIALLGRSGDYMYQQAPMQKIIFEAELLDMFGSANVGAAKHIKRHIDARYGSLHRVMMPLKMILEGYTSEEAVKGSDVNSELLWDTYKRIRGAIHVEEADNILMLLASIGHEELWSELTGKMIDVDYSVLYEDTDMTKPTDSVACAGGACELDFSIPKE